MVNAITYLLEILYAVEPAEESGWERMSDLLHDQNYVAALPLMEEKSSIIYQLSQIC